jgi:hypothetical protein
VPKAESNGEVSKKELARLNGEYLKARNSQMASKAEISAMELARRRGELIPKKAAFDSLSYILICFQRRCLLVHRTIARRLASLGLIDPAKEHAVSEAIAANIREVLTELANMPGKVTNPESWLEELEREELGAAAERKQKQTPEQAQARQAKAQILRQKKTETMRRLRAEGRG